MDELRELRHRNFADSLLENEKALVPFVDEPPIVYPTAEVWEDITRKRAKYKSVDLAGDNERERRIYNALDEDTTLEFLETPLSEVVGSLREEFGDRIEPAETRLSKFVEQMIQARLVEL